MNLQTARFLGASAAVLCGAIYFAWQRLRGPECSGAVYIEIRPPLGAPGPYHFRLNLDEGDRTCEFDVSPDARGMKATHCGMALEIRSRVQGTRSSIVGLTVGSAPEKLRFFVGRGADVVYDTELVPKYAPYETTRQESRRFCGENAFVKPACRRGSASCAPFPPACDGPEDCERGKVCCVSPEWGFEYGSAAATECTSKARCVARLARFACHADADCPDAMLCNDPSLHADFQPPLEACGEKSTKH